MASTSTDENDAVELDATALRRDSLPSELCFW